MLASTDVEEEEELKLLDRHRLTDETESAQPVIKGVVAPRRAGELSGHGVGDVLVSEALGKAAEDRLEPSPACVALSRSRTEILKGDEVVRVLQ